MQLGGVGDRHGSDLHQVTDCMHDHTHKKLEADGARASLRSQAAMMQAQERQQDIEFSMTSWLQKALDRGRSVLGKIWGTSEASDAEEKGDKTGQVQTAAQVRESTAEYDRAGSRQSTVEQMSPYFTAVPDVPTSAPVAFLRRMRSKVVGAAEKLAGKLPGQRFRFQAKNSFHTKSEQRSKENLRKRSRYRDEDLEIDCILTDESYLMDSYDRKGEYSQLTTKK